MRKEMLVLKDRYWEAGRGAFQGNLGKWDEDLITQEYSLGNLRWVLKPVGELRHRDSSVARAQRSFL